MSFQFVEGILHDESGNPSAFAALPFVHLFSLPEVRARLRIETGIVVVYDTELPVHRYVGRKKV